MIKGKVFQKLYPTKGRFERDPSYGERFGEYGRVVLKDSRRKEESRVTRVASKKGEWDYD